MRILLAEDEKALSKAIVEAHGGTISASTKTGSDFRVTVNLPL